VGIPPLIPDDPAPVILNVPQLGEITVPQEKYVVIYPLLMSNNEADHEQAFAQLREQAERDPGSVVQNAAEGRAPRSWIEPTRNDRPGQQIKDGFGNPLRYE